MPLKKVTNKEELSATIGELVRSYKKGGKFAKGKSSKKAHKMAIAAAFDMMRKGRGGK